MISRIDYEHDFADEYDRIRPILLRVLRRIPNALTIEENERLLIEGICSRRLTLWTGDASVAVTEICEQDHRRCLWFVYVAGDLLEIMDEGLPIVEAYAFANDCEITMFQGRRGWDCDRIKKYGFKPMHVVMAKEIVGQHT